MLSQGEYEELQRTIRNSKYSPDDFEISTVDYVDRCEHLHVELTRVFIRHIPNNLTRTYIAGSSSFWLRRLEHDVETGVYDDKLREESVK